jgi:hypothetical protein
VHDKAPPHRDISSVSTSSCMRNGDHAFKEEIMKAIGRG